MALLDHVPTVRRRPWAAACLVMNVLLPGTGTMVAAGRGEDGKNVAFGVVQLVLFWVLFLPWLWSIVWGVLIYRKSQ